MAEDRDERDYEPSKYPTAEFWRLLGWALIVYAWCQGGGLIQVTYK